MENSIQSPGKSAGDVEIKTREKHSAPDVNGAYLQYIARELSMGK